MANMNMGWGCDDYAQTNEDIQAGNTLLSLLGEQDVKSVQIMMKMNMHEILKMRKQFADILGRNGM